jgi:hypothetical protein
MKNSYLIQRLKKPYGASNPFSFGGGLRNGGLSEEAMELLNGVFSFDYMGAAEFEFGAVPKALQLIAKDANQYLTTTLSIPQNKVAKAWRDKSTEAPTGEAVVYVICRKGDVQEVHIRIKQFAANKYDKNLKETTRLPGALRPIDDWDRDVQGWLELDNGFFFFTDKEMWKKTAELFGIETA